MLKKDVATTKPSLAKCYYEGKLEKVNNIVEEWVGDNWRSFFFKIRLNINYVMNQRST